MEGSEAVSIEALDQNGGVSIDSRAGGTKMTSVGALTFSSSQRSETAISVSAMDTDGGVLLSAGDTIALSSSGADASAISIVSTSSTGGVSLNAGTSGSGSFDSTSGSGGTYMGSRWIHWKLLWCRNNFAWIR